MSVKFRKFTIDVAEVFPDMIIPPGNSGRHIRIAKLDSFEVGPVKI